MAESVTVARPYAEAAFRVAKECGSLDSWSALLQRLALVVQDSEMAALIGNPKFSGAQLAACCLELSADDKSKPDPLFSNFLGTLAENERLSLLPDIANQFQALRNAEAGEQDALIESAFPLDAAQLKTLLSELEPHFHSKLKAQVKINQDLIGGLRITVGDRVLDASVRGKLVSMSQSLKS